MRVRLQPVPCIAAPSDGHRSKFWRFRLVDIDMGRQRFYRIDRRRIHLSVVSPASHASSPYQNPKSKRGVQLAVKACLLFLGAENRPSFFARIFMYRCTFFYTRTLCTLRSSIRVIIANEKCHEEPKFQMRSRRRRPVKMHPCVYDEMRPQTQKRRGNTVV